MSNHSWTNVSFKECNFSKLNGTSDLGTDFMAGEFLTIKLFLGIFSLVGSVENIAVVVAILTSDTLLDVPSHWFVLSLAFADTLDCLLTVPEVSRLSQSGIIAFRVVFLFTLLSSSGSLLILTFNRFLSIFDSLKYPSRMTIPRAKLLVSAAWGIAVLLCLVSGVAILADAPYLLDVTAVYYTSVTVLTIGLNSYMVKKASEQRRIIKLQHKAVLTGQQKSLISEYRSLFRLVTITATNFATCIPYFILVHSYPTVEAILSVSFQHSAMFVHLVMLLNTVIDPLIYFINSAQFKEFLTKVKRRILIRHGLRRLRRPKLVIHRNRVGEIERHL